MKRVFVTILLVLCFAVCLFSGYKVVTTLLEYQKAREGFDTIASEFTAPAATPKPTEKPAEAASGEPEETEPELVPPISVDFEQLRGYNSDVVGWIYAVGTNINYPVVQSDDNDYYLHRDMDGNYSAAGTIFIDCDNASDFSDGNTIIYGHHMKDGSMFAQLEKFADWETLPEMWLLTPGGNYKVEVYAGYVTSPSSATYTLYSSAEQALLDYSENAVYNSEFYSDVVPELGQRQIVLSTCDYTFQNARYVIHGVLYPCGN